MKEFVKSSFFILVLGIIIAVSYFYTPTSIKVLNNKINQSNPTSSDTARLNLFKEYGNFLIHHLPENNPALYFYWYSNQRKISDLRVKKAVEEIKNTKVDTGKIKIWSLLNMGVVLKTKTHTLAIDTANLPFSQAHNGLAELVDIFIVSHMDGDHYDPTLLKKALSKNKKVIFLDGIPLLENNSNNITIASGEFKNVDGIKVSAYQTDHRGDGNFIEPCAWFIVEIDGFKLLHTGDGRDFKNKSEYQKVYSMRDFDVLLANNQLHPYNIRDLGPKILIPLHLFKFMSGDDLYRESTIEAVMENFEKYSKDLQGIKRIFLLPGESYTYSVR